MRLLAQGRPNWQDVEMSALWSGADTRGPLLGTEIPKLRLYGPETKFEQECVSSIPPSPAGQSGVKPGLPRNARQGRKCRLFAHSISSPDTQFAGLEVETAESLRPCLEIFPF